MMVRCYSLAWILALVVVAEARPNEPITTKQALARATNYLWNQQQKDGSWRSEYYGVMRSGQALTPFVLSALVQSPGSLSKNQSNRALDAARFITQHMDRDGAIGRRDPDVLEYPVYSTAFALGALQNLREKGLTLSTDDDRAMRKMCNFLIAAQYQDRNGFNSETLAYGGWGFNAPVAEGVVGHMDLAHTRKALTALTQYCDTESPMLIEARRRALRFLRLMQKDPGLAEIQPLPHGIEERTGTAVSDGGFYFSPIALSANKAPYDPNQHCWPSYATATCDGALALLAAGGSPHDPKLQAAIRWLRRYPEVDYPAGIPTDHPEPWGDSVRFYHYAVRAEAWRKLGFPQAELDRLAAALIARQREDGSFVNSVSPLMKEDDPLLCTALAVVALANSLPQ